MRTVLPLATGLDILRAAGFTAVEELVEMGLRAGAAGNSSVNKRSVLVRMRPTVPLSCMYSKVQAE